LVDQNRLDEQKLAVLQALDRNQNPYRLPSHERAAWLSELPYADEVLFGSGAEPEYVYWLGCTAAYDVRASQAVRATFDLFRAAGVSFATLGPSERCCGEPAKRLGEEGRFQMLAMANIEMLRETGARAVVTHCPHCLNVLAHEYRSLGFEIPVKHHSELLAELMAGGCLAVEHGDEASTGVVYHEPCNLARSDRPGAPAFDLLVAATGDGVVVPPRSGRRTFCCGGGGANMWYTVEEESRRISAIRLDELVATGAPTVATSCPFCLSMLTDAAGSRSEKGIEIKDIAEVVYQCRERGETSGDSES
jgi:Fe-S oxidoreductase